jgi:hypothetical protein
MNENPLAEVDFVEVAKIAAMIQTPGFGPRQKIKEAYDLLAIAKFYKTESLKAGIDPSLLIYYKENRIDPKEEEDSKPHPLYDEVRSAYLQFDPETDEELPVSYKEGLARIITKVKPADRESRFASYLASTGKKSKIKEFKNSGFEWSDFENCYVGYRLWWEKELKRIKSKARKGKTGKQGQVLRRGDKRKGARAGNFFEKIKKIS